MGSLFSTGEKGQLQRGRRRLSMRGSGVPMTDRHFYSSALPERILPAEKGVLRSGAGCFDA